MYAYAGSFDNDLILILISILVALDITPFDYIKYKVITSPIQFYDNTIGHLLITLVPSLV